MTASPRIGLRLAIGTLTVVPVGALPTISKRDGAWAMSLASVAVLPLSVAAMLVSAGASLVRLPAEVAAALVLVILAWGTRAMHWDALADTADGFAAGWDRERALAVMRLGNVGPTGAGVLVMALLLDVFALARIQQRPWAWMLIGVLVVASRGALALAASVCIPAARREGLGAVVASSVPWPVSVAVVTLLSASLILAAAPSGIGRGQALLAAACAFATVVWLLHHAHRILGGVTGDVMGAAIELQFTVMAIVLCAGSAR